VDDDDVINNGEQFVFNDDVVVVADIPKLKFQTATHENGNAYANFQFEVHDGTEYSTAKGRITIHVTAVNDLPTSPGSVVTATEDLPFTFASSDFPFVDVANESQTLNKIKLQPVSVGTLWLDLDNDGTVNGLEAAIGADNEVAVADITKLRYLSALHGNGTGYDSFEYAVFDGLEYSAANSTMTIHVTAVNDAQTYPVNTVTAV
jgi:hypothetical protein